MHGVVSSLTQRTMGGSIAAAAAVGATQLSLDDVSDFDEDGGWLSLDGAQYQYAGLDMDNNLVLALTPALSAAAALSDPVAVWDPDYLVTVAEYTALVTVDGQTDGDPVYADIDHSLSTLLSSGTFMAGQSVTVDEDGDGFIVTKVHGKNNKATQVTTAANVQYGIDQGGGNIAGLVVVADNGSVRLATLTDVRVKTPDNTTFLPVVASAFTVSSDPRLKTRPTPAPDALSIIRDAPASQWRYLTDAPQVRRIGPMADELPDWLAQDDGEDGLTLDLARTTGVLWAAFGQQLQINAELRARIESLEER